MNETKAFITQLCGAIIGMGGLYSGGPVITIVVVNRDVVCVMIVMLSWRGAGGKIGS